MHLLLITAAHGVVSFPELQLDCEASAVHYQQRCLCEPTVCFTLQHGTLEKMTVHQVLFWQEATLQASLLGPLMNCSEALGGDEEQGRQRAYRSTTVNKNGAVTW